MKYLIIFLSLFLMTACTSHSSRNINKEHTEIKPEKNDDGEWDIHVIDTQYDYFLKAIAKPISMYSEASLKNRNAILVSEWNSYFFSGRYRNVIESSIDYNPNENYGLQFEYKLYQVFAYVSWKYGLKLNGLSGTDTF